MLLELRVNEEICFMITIEALRSGKISSGRGLNKEIALKRTGDTRCGSHYETIFRLISLFPSIVNVLEYVEEDGNNSEQRVSLFCAKYNITDPKIDDIFVSQRRSRHNAQKISNLHHL
ncbi:hypothetical protein HN873_047769 [Arachis hypogaea]